MYVKIPILPGFYKDESPLAAEGFAIDGENVRVSRGRFETQKGREPFSASAMSDAGLCRGMLAYVDNSSNKRLIMGTHRGLWHSDQDGNLTDITPVYERGELTNPFVTVANSTTITVRDDGHNLVENQKVRFFGQSSVAGLTIATAYSVSSALTSSTYSIIHTASAVTSTAGGGTVDYEYQLAPGNAHNIGSGGGYGVGGYGTGGYGSTSTAASFDVRTWDVAQWGQNVIANCPGQGLFEFGPNTVQTEIVTAGDMSSAAAFTAGSGWTVAGGNASAVTTTQSLSQSITLNQGAWHLLDFDVVRTTGTINSVINSSTIGTVITATGTYKRAFYSGAGGAQTLAFQPGTLFTGQIDNVSVRVMNTAHLLPSPAPQIANGVFVSHQQPIVVAYGTIDTDSNYSPMRVNWSGIENHMDWALTTTASAASLAGGITLTHGSKIVRGMAGFGENLLWTDTTLVSMRFNPNPLVVFTFDALGSGNGLIGPRAAVVAGNGTAYWVSPAFEFLSYSPGGLPQHLDSTLSRDVFDNLSKAQQTKIYAFPIDGKNEIHWLIPDGRDGTECSREVIFNYAENTWVYVPNSRTAGIDAGVFEFPIMVTPTSRPFYHDKGDSSAGSQIYSKLETGWFNLGDGDEFVDILGMIPDFEDLSGGLTVTIKTRLYPNGAERSYGPYSITAAKKKVDFRVTGRQVKLIFESDDAPSFWRLGDSTYDIRRSGSKR